MQGHPYFESAKKIILAHRGSTPPTENTLQAFEQALRAGADCLETDVRSTMDGHAVLVHDGDLKRLAGLDLRVSELTLNEIQKIELFAGGKITTLAEALQQFTNTRFNIDIKVPEAVIPTVQAIEKLQAHQRVLVSSFSNSIRKQALSFLTKPVATSASAATVLKAKLYSFLGIRLDSLLSGIGAIQVPTSMYGLRFTNKRFVRNVLKTGTHIHYWTINTAEEVQELLAIGASGIVTDNVEMAKRVINSSSGIGNK